MDFEFDTLLKAIRDGIKTGTASELAELMREYNTPFMNIVTTGWIESNCADIMFINYTPLSVVTGGNVTVNNYTLQPGGFVGISGNNSEINKDRYLVVFDVSATNVVIIKRLYTKR